MAQKVERKGLDMMEELMKNGGPFTDAQEVEQYLSHEVVAANTKIFNRVHV